MRAGFVAVGVSLSLCCGVPESLHSRSGADLSVSEYAMVSSGLAPDNHLFCARTMISADTLRGALVLAGVPGGTIALYDSDYELPEANWITGEFREAFNRYLFDNRIKYSPRFDCNKFAKAASLMADRCWDQEGSTEAVLAFGMFAMVRHMMNIAVHLKVSPADPSRELVAEDLRVAFYEPQPSPVEGQAVFSLVTMQEIHLSLVEVQTCVSCNFL